MIEAERFHVDSDFYHMFHAYGTFCAREANALIKNPPPSLTKLLEELAPKIKAHYQEIKPHAKNDNFGEFRNVEKPTDSLMDGKFGHTFAEAEKGGRELTIRHVIPEWADSSRQEPVTLTSTERNGRFHNMNHLVSPDEENTFHAEHIWSAASQAYHKALDPKQDKAERRKEAINCYWLISHYMPYKRGTATAARIMLEFMADAIGFETGCTRRNVDLNIEALTRTQEDFQQKFNDFFTSEPRRSRPVYFAL